MGPRVVEDDGHALGSAALSGKQQTAVARSADTVYMIHITVVLSSLTILRAESVALIGIRCSRAGGVVHTIHRAWRQSQVHGRVDLLYGPHVTAARSDVTCGYKPIRLELPLKAEVPLSDPHIRRVVVLGRYECVERPWRIAADSAPVWLRERISPWIVCPRVLKIYRVEGDDWKPRRFEFRV